MLGVDTYQALVLLWRLIYPRQCDLLGDKCLSHVMHRMRLVSCKAARLQGCVAECIEKDSYPPTQRSFTLCPTKYPERTTTTRAPLIAIFVKDR